jgi:hypothetical protein
LKFTLEKNDFSEKRFFHGEKKKKKPKPKQFAGTIPALIFNFLIYVFVL